MTLQIPYAGCLNPAFIGALALCLSLGASALEAPSIIPVENNKNLWLQTGNFNDAYWVHNNRWGAGSITEGPGANQYEQFVGTSNNVGPNGEVAFRINWRWPDPPGSSEVKGYPAIVSGNKPGHYSADHLVNGHPVRLPDGKTLITAPTGATPGTFFPLKLPLTSLKAKFAHKHLTPPSGEGHLTFDIWLQSASHQDGGWGNSSITHQIRIPLEHWGGYGQHPAGRNPGWYDHDAVIGGKLYHAYASKGPDGALLYNFGALNGNYGKTGWKMITFVPAVLPAAAGEIDLAAIVNYVATRKDVAGNPWGLGNEYVASVELGVEPKAGSGDIVVYDYRVSTGAVAPAPASAAKAAVAAAPAPARVPMVSACTFPAWDARTMYPPGRIVSYLGRLFFAKGGNFINIAPPNTAYWSVHYCLGAYPAPAGLVSDMSAAVAVESAAKSTSLSSASTTAVVGHYYVAPGGTGTGTANSPFGKISQALAVASAGNIIVLENGIYNETISTVRPGTSSAPIKLVARNRGMAIVKATGRALNVNHAYIIVDGLVLDGNYGASDTVKVTSTGTAFQLKRSEVRRSSRDCIDLDAPANVLIEDSLIHHCLWWSGERKDAHGIVSGGSIKNLTIRRTEVHTFSGDAFQVDPVRSLPGWDNVVIEGSHFWLQPLPAAENGFPAGMVPGENAVDTKVPGNSAYLSRITIRDTKMNGFRQGSIYNGVGNLAALNLKERVNAFVENVTIFDSEIGLRLRFPATVRVQNSVLFNNAKAVRYEDGVKPKLYNMTFGLGNNVSFQNVGGTPDVRNSLFVGPLPSTQAPRSKGNMSSTSTAHYLDLPSHNYRITSTSPAANAGIAISGVILDADRRARPNPPSVGAYEAP